MRHIRPLQQSNPCVQLLSVSNGNCHGGPSTGLAAWDPYGMDEIDPNIIIWTLSSRPDLYARVAARNLTRGRYLIRYFHSDSYSSGGTLTSVLFSFISSSDPAVSSTRLWFLSRFHTRAYPWAVHHNLDTLAAG
ncbi:hypothetical protein V2G26_020066 [Clonostachys chloroleuca]